MTSAQAHPLAAGILQTPRARRASGLLVAICGSVTLSACHPDLTVGTDPSARSDRLKAYYGDLESGRFAVIADFEHPRHLELFRVASPSGKARMESHRTAGITETGPAGIRFTLTGPDDALIANNQRVSEWFMKRDWRDYDLLLMQLRAPRPGVEVEVSIVAGPTGRRDAIHSLLPLREGWNLVRLDLGEVAEYLPLDDIAELRWSVPQAAEPVELALDDVILTNNTEDLFGDSDPTAGRLYVRRRGRRWAVGAGGRFELGFGGGQIVQWYDLGADPNRLNNLVANTVMGPSPIVMPTDDPNMPPGTRDADFTTLGETVVARQRILEASRIRIVVEAEWRFVRRGRAPADDSPFQRWIYAIYPSGNIYIHVECTTAFDDWRPEDIGLAVSRTDFGSMELLVHPPAQLRDTGRLRHLAFAYSRSDTLDAPALLFVLHDARRAPDLEFFREPDARRTTLVASGGKLGRETDSWTCMCNVWPANNATGTNATDQALDYSYAGGRINVTTGRLLTNDLGDDNGDGFNERLGCYVLAPESQQLRFTLDGRQQRMFYPAFSVKHSAGVDAWVYQDFTVLEPTARDANGDLLFQIPQVVDKEVTIEIYFRDRFASASLDTP
ncbi:MAG: hypothetical protein JSV19_00045 [Phycisphaerales bacterium]|nr:MAG: hypothetical protein JSV19_00045 [Phycisphaerales bacterium]